MPPVATHTLSSRSPIGLHALAAAGLLIAIGSSAMMAAPHVLGVPIPGCGPGGGCEQASASAWSRIPTPWGDWPVAFAGLAYFVAMSAAWIVARGRLPVSLRWAARLGDLASVGFVILMILGGYVCPYCLMTHLGNAVFWIAAEFAGRRLVGRGRGSTVTFAAMFLLTSGVLGVGHWRQTEAARGAAERARAESVRQIMEPPAPEIGADLEPYGPHRPFTGRWRIGPEQAAIRIVIFSDYQCIDCKRIEQEIRAVLAQRGDISFSAKHFPFCRPCNEKLESDAHPNACWAARAAEAAGILRGNDGFWAMHHWLFDRGGGFTDAELKSRLLEQGYDVQPFIDLMTSDQTLRPVREDVEEGWALGLHFTPMVFVNGIELKGWNAPQALTRSVAQIAGLNLPAKGPDDDRPPLSLQKHLDDWRQQPMISLPPDLTPRELGPDSTPVTIVLWGDYREASTAGADREIRKIVSQRADVRYHFRHFPIDQTCNPAAPRTMHEHACLAAKAAEAAGRVGGPQAFWAMHQWLMDHQSDAWGDGPLRRAALELQLDPDALVAAMEAAEVGAAIAEDALAARQVGVRSIPLIYLNGRFVPRWHLEGHDLLMRMVQVAAVP